MLFTWFSALNVIFSTSERPNVVLKSDFAFTTLKGWGMGALVSQAQDMFNCDNKLTTKWIRDTSSNVLHAPKPDT